MSEDKRSFKEKLSSLEKGALIRVKYAGDKKIEENIGFHEGLL